MYRGKGKNDETIKGMSWCALIVPFAILPKKFVPLKLV